jgi:hypothetical protein
MSKGANTSFPKITTYSYIKIAHLNYIFTIKIIILVLILILSVIVCLICSN